MNLMSKIVKWVRSEVNAYLEAKLEQMKYEAEQEIKRLQQMKDLSGNGGYDERISIIQEELDIICSRLAEKRRTRNHST